MPQEASESTPIEPTEIADWWPFSATSTLLLLAACLAFVEVALCIDGERWLEATVPLVIAAIMIFSTRGQVFAGAALGAYGLMLGAIINYSIQFSDQNLLHNGPEILPFQGLINAGSGAIFGGAIQAVHQRQYLIGLVPPVAYMGFEAFQFL